ncbi:hypothetical protein LOTGIDRAFT_157164 [Lottia gigantea]|uniref:Uncharacterized protein n=1 Tax=Lottia gigantea TaxID=225164 RepID=V4ADE6_LOTGI|nr:hypothetical protein LOTGIDRAFT_157164 [Lottia gigantea]ESP02034.1 hypothetical protein LOTGIDRAFT_157164 [Lottia gigantea]
MANKFGLGSLSLETKKPNTTAWINKAKPYFLDQIGDTLQGDLDMNNFSITNLKSPENDNDAIHKKYLMEQLNLIEVNKNHLKERIGDVKRFFKRQLNNKHFIDDTKLQKEVTSLKKFIQQQLVNAVDKTQLQNLSSLISNLDDKITKQKIDLKQLIANINPDNLVLKQDKNILALEKKFLKKESYYFTLPFRSLSFEDASITDNTDKSKDFEYKKYGFTANIRVYSVPNYTIYPKTIFEPDDVGHHQPMYFRFRGKLTIEITFPFQVKVDSIFLRQNPGFSSKPQFNVLQFINGTTNVETKELEINDENTQRRHLYEIKTSGKYIDRFRMLIIPDNEEDVLSLNDFNMLLETETPPSASIIRNPEPQKELINYQFLRATDFEYVKLYFVDDNDIFISLDIHKSQ